MTSNLYSGDLLVIYLWIWLALTVAYYEISAYYVRKRTNDKEKEFQTRYQKRCADFLCDYIEVCRIYADLKFKAEQVDALATYSLWVAKVPDLQTLRGKYHRLNIKAFLNQSEIVELMHYIPNLLTIFN